MENLPITAREDAIHFYFTVYNLSLFILLHSKTKDCVGCYAKLLYSCSSNTCDTLCNLHLLVSLDITPRPSLTISLYTKNYEINFHKNLNLFLHHEMYVKVAANLLSLFQ